MRLRNITGADEVIENSPYTIKSPTKQKGNWQSVFKQKAQLHIEIGMGKGRFLMEMAATNPNINYIGIEKYSSVLLRAVQKLEEQPLDNLRFVLLDAAKVEDVFEQGEVDRIYLNFSDPWPKDRHAKRRLPSRQFLSKFSNILKQQGVIEFKTDNRDLFDFAVEEVESSGFKIEKITYDLHHDEEMNRGNIMTEYEEKFSLKGNPIYKYIIKR